MNAIKDMSFRWPSGRIPYVISASFCKQFLVDFPLENDVSLQINLICLNSSKWAEGNSKSDARISRKDLHSIRS